jgi:flagellar hook-length control protein FliK
MSADGRSAGRFAHRHPGRRRGWDAEVGQKVVWMVNRTESRAELTLTPPHMGKVDVTIDDEGDQTSASFVAASPAAREALEQALPRLREILADAGITLGQASVNAESPRNGRPTETPGGAASAAAAQRPPAAAAPVDCGAANG